MNSQGGQSSRLYVGGLDLSIQEKDLEEIFSKYGKILEIRWRKNFAFIQFSDDSEAQDAIKDLNGSQHFGRMLDVQIARHPRSGGGVSGGNAGGPPKGNDDMPSRDRSPIGRSGGGGGGRGGMGGRGGGFGGRGDRGMYNSGGSRNSFNDDMPPNFGGRGGVGGGNIGDFRSDYRGGGGDFPPRQDPSPFGGRSDNSLFGGGSSGSGRDFSLVPPTGFRDPPGGGSKFWGGGSGSALNEKAFDSRNRGNEISSGMQYSQERPPTHPVESTSVPNNERTNDIEIIVVEKSLTDYGEMIERRMSCLGFSVDVLFPHEAVPLPRVLANIASRGTLYAVVITHVHKINRSLTLHVLHSRPQEHRNIAIDDAVTLLLRNYESYTRNCRENGTPNCPPEQIRHLLTQVLNGRKLTVTQYDILVQHLIQEKLKVEPQGNQVSEVQSSTAQQAELQTRILSILNKTPVGNDQPPVLPPSALQTTDGTPQASIPVWNSLTTGFNW